MAPLAQQSVETKQEIALDMLRSWLQSRVEPTVRATDLQSELQDICLELRCGWLDLPHVMQEFHKEVRSQLDDQDYGACGFFVQCLLDSIDRASRTTA